MFEFLFAGWLRAFQKRLEGVAHLDQTAAHGNFNRKRIAPPLNGRATDDALDVAGSAFKVNAAAIGDERQELFFLPAAQKRIGQCVLHRLGNDVEYGFDRFASARFPEMSKLQDLDAQDSKGKMVFDMAGEALAQVGLGETVIGQPGSDVETAIRREVRLPAIGGEHRTGFIKTFRGAYDRAVATTNRGSPDPYRQAMAQFVSQIDMSFSGAPLLEGAH